MSWWIAAHKIMVALVDGLSGLLKVCTEQFLYHFICLFACCYVIIIQCIICFVV